MVDADLAAGTPGRGGGPGGPGGPGGTGGELEELASTCPLRETLHARPMPALCVWVGAVQAQVSRLRRSPSADVSELPDGGCRLTADPDDVKVHLSERLSRHGRRLLAAGNRCLCVPFPGRAELDA